MYLAGYSIECKLKARLMEMYNLDRLEQLEVEIERRLQHPVSVFTHSIEVLFDFTGARARLLANPKSQLVLQAYHLCNTWKPAWRYKPDEGSQNDCDSFLEAVEVFSKFIDYNT